MAEVSLIDGRKKWGKIQKGDSFREVRFPIKFPGASESRKPNMKHFFCDWQSWVVLPFAEHSAKPSFTWEWLDNLYLDYQIFWIEWKYLKWKR